MFPPIGSYGFLSDCHTSALVAPEGDVEWLCVPRFDSPSVFGTILDRSAGHFKLAPAGTASPLSRRYEPGTLVLETTWCTDTGWVVIRDALTIAEWADQDESGRPRVDHEQDHSIVRVAECIEGEVDLEMVCMPRFDYGRGPALWSGGELGEALAQCAETGTKLHLTSDIDLRLEQGSCTGRVHLREGERAFTAVSWGEGIETGPTSAPEAAERLDSTKEFWRQWLQHGEFPDHPWRGHLQRSALVLKGLTFSPTGAILAAATTSLPETPGGERNWDYRFSWIRDSTFSLWALHTLGFDEEARAFMGYARRCVLGSDGSLQIMYGIGHEKDLTESTLDHLSGYGGARPVRIGNGAFDQRQNDVWGAMLDSIYLHRKALQPEHLDEETRQLIVGLAEAAMAAWPHPDQGIWEARGEPKHYVSSKLMIWVAIDRAARMGEQWGDPDKAAEWRLTADQMKDEILREGVRDGIFRQHYETDALDASTLLIPLLRFLPPDDRRIRDTVRAIQRELTNNGLVLRYLTEETDDGLSGEEGTFLICSFWLVAALSEIGEPREAKEMCERLLASAGSLGLFAEELEAHTNRHLGNFPQAFTHLALINAVSHVIADEQRDGAPGGTTAVFTEMRS